jgi:hypothetical protein
VDGRSALWTAQAEAAALPELDDADDELDDLDDELDDVDELSDFDDDAELSDFASDFDSDFESDFESEFFAESPEDSFAPLPARLSLR